MECVSDFRECCESRHGSKNVQSFDMATRSCHLQIDPEAFIAILGHMWHVGVDWT